VINEGVDQFALSIDKFTFRFPKDLKYSEAGVWVRREGDRLRLGLSDFAQQRSGDIAFVNLAQPGTDLKLGDEVASIETIKVNVSLPVPVAGRIMEINAAVQESPELINLEPYTRGWFTILQVEDLEGQVAHLLSAAKYAALAKEQAETELIS
jgi:glycine cleavage system H protein